MRTGYVWSVRWYSGGRLRGRVQRVHYGGCYIVNQCDHQGAQGTAVTLRRAGAARALQKPER